MSMDYWHCPHTNTEPRQHEFIGGMFTGIGIMIVAEYNRTYIDSDCMNCRSGGLPTRVSVRRYST